MPGGAVRGDGDMESSRAPIQNKVRAAGVAASLTVILVWVAGMVGVDVPPEVASAITTLFAFAGGYMARA